MKVKDLNKIGILGAGVMGGGIAQSAIQAGYNVIIRDLTIEICENARETILNSRFGFNNAVQMDKMSAEELFRTVMLYCMINRQPKPIFLWVLCRKAKLNLKSMIPFYLKWRCWALSMAMRQQVQPA